MLGRHYAFAPTARISPKEAGQTRSQSGNVIIDCYVRVGVNLEKASTPRKAIICDLLRLFH